MDKQISFPLGITFDDVLLIPGYADFSRSNIDLSTQLTKNIKLAAPFVSSPMDTVTESKLAIALAEEGGIGIIHRNLTIIEQANQVSEVANRGLLVGAAIGANKGFEDRAKALINAGVSIILIDSAHGNAKTVIDAVKYMKKTYPKVEVIAGNVATKEGAENLIKAGVDGLRVGMGPGAICTTRIISGMGVPQLTAIMETSSVGKKAKVPVIADGGIKYSGDMVKAFAAGAETVMMGSYFAGALEAPGKTHELKPEQVPSRFKSILNKKQATYTFKEYRGMGSIAAMQEGARIKSEDEFHGKSYKDRVLVAEGVESLTPIKGTLKEIVDQTIGGIRSGMYYVGVKTIDELQEKGRFMQITQASLTESHPHDILITNSGENY
ncbi:MAG TPA: IMP dehydrogenase [Candidatus Sulfotelmatobacter sp.]|jgi:IMP dehydrogenase|nr:IMP dehydrogenase [Candidatus Sulfotelmatobacter sp.]